MNGTEALRNCKKEEINMMTSMENETKSLLMNIEKIMKTNEKLIKKLRNQDININIEDILDVKQKENENNTNNTADIDMLFSKMQEEESTKKQEDIFMEKHAPKLTKPKPILSPTSDKTTCKMILELDDDEDDDMPALTCTYSMDDDIICVSKVDLSGLDVSVAEKNHESININKDEKSKNKEAKILMDDEAYLFRMTDVNEDGYKIPKGYYKVELKESDGDNSYKEKDDPKLLPRTLPLKKSLKKPMIVNRYMPTEYYIEYDGYMRENMMELYCVCVKEQMDIYVPLYEYIEKTVAPLKLKTPFIEIAGRPLLNNFEKTKEILLEITSKNMINNILPILMNIDEYGKREMNNIYGKKVKLWSQTVRNRGVPKKGSSYVNIDERYSPLSVYMTNGSRVINYNVSKNYPKVEEIAEVTGRELKRFCRKGKEVRMILKPIIWVNREIRRYGIKWKINTMEIKFKGAQIESRMDEEEIEVEQEYELNI